jgi:NTP pyrophosphatase (non-canonical NTP hydrolase)
MTNQGEVTMNIADLQGALRHFAAERNWQPLHTPKNLSTALMVEAAALAEIFQWMTPEESREAHLDPASKQRIGAKAADVLLDLVQLADHSQIDLALAVKDRLAGNALKYPAKRTMQPVSQAEFVPLDTHVLLDYENVQPTEQELRTIVPDATKVWVFHGPHQKQIERRFTSFGTGMTPVPISKTGKNALDFHLSFYMGYIVSRSQRANIVVVANDKGYGPMLEHAKTMGFAVRQQGHARTSQGLSDKPIRAVKPSPPAKAGAKKAAAKKASKKASKKVPVKKLPANTATAPKTAKSSSAVKGGTPVSAASPKAASPSPGSPALLQKMTESLRKMDDKRPVRQASLRRALKPLLGMAVSESSIEVALNNLIARGVVAVGHSGDVTYPIFKTGRGAIVPDS